MHIYLYIIAAYKICLELLRCFFSSSSCSMNAMMLKIELEISTSELFWTQHVSFII